MRTTVRDRTINARRYSRARPKAKEEANKVRVNHIGLLGIVAIVRNKGWEVAKGMIISHSVEISIRRKIRDTEDVNHLGRALLLILISILLLLL